MTPLALLGFEPRGFRGHVARKGNNLRVATPSAGVGRITKYSTRTCQRRWRTVATARRGRSAAKTSATRLEVFSLRSETFTASSRMTCQGRVGEKPFHRSRTARLGRPMFRGQRTQTLLTSPAKANGPGLLPGRSKLWLNPLRITPCDGPRKRRVRAAPFRGTSPSSRLPGHC